MKKIIAVALLVSPAAAFSADVLVNGYIKQDGTYVAPHYQTAPNNTRVDNYSTVGNVNPYTGVQGTKPLEPNPYNYAQPKQPQQPTYPSYVPPRY